MKKYLKFYPLILITFLIIISCGQNRDYQEYATDSAEMEYDNASNPQVLNDVNVIERKIIKEGDIRFETNDAKKTRSVISKSVTDLNGYISNDNIYEYNNMIEYSVTIRMPSENFEILMENISSTASKIQSKNINALDVTEEFIDIESRIKTKKELESRYIEILKQAKNVEEILSIEKEIEKLRTEIESVEGRLRYLKDRVSYSTLTVVFYEKSSSPFDFGTKFGNAIKSGWNNLLWFLIGLTNLWPFILAGILIFILLRSFSKRKKSVKKNTD